MKRVLIVFLFLFLLASAVDARSVSIVNPQTGAVIIEEDIFIEAPRISEQVSASKAKASVSGEKKVFSLDNSGKEFDLQNSEVIPWGVERVRAPYVWDKSKGSGIKVAILDSGVADHPDLNLAEKISLIDSDGGSPDDFFGHGTMVAGVIGAQENEFGIVGVAPEAELYSIKVINESGGFLSDILDGIDWAIENDMDIVSMSFGSPVDSSVFEIKLAEAYNSGIVLFASSGNDGGDILFPAKYTSVVAVGNIDSNNEVPFGNTGPSQELVAPGTEILTTFLDNSYVIASGTSFSAPHAVGVATLILGDEKKDPSSLRNKLQEDALDLGIDGKDETFGYGLVQASFSESSEEAEDLEKRVSVLELWKSGADLFLIDLFSSISDLFSISSDHETRLDVLESNTGELGAATPNYFKYLSSSDRKKIVCGYGEDNHLEHYEDLGWSCNFAYRETSRGERVSCRCSQI